MYRAMDVYFHLFLSEKYAIFVCTSGKLAGTTTLKCTGPCRWGAGSMRNAENSQWYNTEYCCRKNA